MSNESAKPRLIPAISLWQPWATLIAIGAKRIETRSWPTTVRGRIAIHAAKKWDGSLARMCEDEPFASALWDGLTEMGGRVLTPREALPFGAIVAVAELVECRRAELFKPDERERAFGDYTLGRWGFRLENVKRVGPVPCLGRQGFFEVEDLWDTQRA